MAWAFSIPPNREELLSGYLSRVAFAHGGSPHAFYQLHLGDGWFWTRDIDRGVSKRHHEAISRDSGVGISALQMMTLNPWIIALTPAGRSGRSPPAVVSWINAVGLHREDRALHALQYCPECLCTHSTVKRQWRLAFSTYCIEHHRPLADSCRNCNAPFVPHRSLGSILRCSNCQSVLSSAQHRGMQDHGIDEILEMQKLLMAALDSAANASSAAKADLLALRILVSTLLANPQKAQVTNKVLGGRPISVDHWGQLEFARIDQRMIVLANLHALLDGWPDTWRYVAAKLNITQRAFSRCKVDAQWLKEEVQRLPEGWTRHKWRRCSLEAKVAELEMARPANWRAKRGALFIQAANRS